MIQPKNTLPQVQEEIKEEPVLSSDPDEEFDEMFLKRSMRQSERVGAIKVTGPEDFMSKSQEIPGLVS